MVRHLAFEGEIIICLPNRTGSMLLLQVLNHQALAGNLISVRLPDLAVLDMLFEVLPEAGTPDQVLAQSVYGWSLAGHQDDLVVFHSFKQAPYPLVAATHAIRVNPLQLLWSRQDWELMTIRNGAFGLIASGSDETEPTTWLNFAGQSVQPALVVEQPDKYAIPYTTYSDQDIYMPQFRELVRKLDLPEIKSYLAYAEINSGFKILYSSSDEVVKAHINHEGVLVTAAVLELVYNGTLPNAYHQVNNTDLVIVNGSDLVAFSDPN